MMIEDNFRKNFSYDPATVVCHCFGYTQADIADDLKKSGRSLILERIAATAPTSQPLDYFTDPELRRELMERDGWRCQYCGDAVTPETATLDHVVPQRLTGPDTPENLKTAWIMEYVKAAGVKVKPNEATGLAAASLKKFQEATPDLTDTDRLTMLIGGEVDVIEGSKRE